MSSPLADSWRTRKAFWVRVVLVLRGWVRQAEVSGRQVLRKVLHTIRFERWGVRPITEKRFRQLKTAAVSVSDGELHQKIQQLNERTQQSASLIAHLRLVEAEYLKVAPFAAAVVRADLPQIIYQLSRTNAAIESELSGQPARIIQPPEGQASPAILEELLGAMREHASAVASYGELAVKEIKTIKQGVANFVVLVGRTLFEHANTDAEHSATQLVLTNQPAQVLDTLIVLSEKNHGSRPFQFMVPFFASPREFPISWPSTLSPLQIVDIGSQILETEDDIYAPLRRSGPTKVIGFDPFVSKSKSQSDPVDVKRPDGSVVKTFPFLIGDGQQVTFHVNRYDATSSILAANHNLTKAFGLLDLALETTKTVELQTRTLDWALGKQVVPDFIDFLKIDVQGASHTVLAHARHSLQRTLVCHVEAEFVQVYENEEVFAGIDALLREAGFCFVDFYSLGRQRYAHFDASPKHGLHRGRTLWGDCIYLRGLDSSAALSPEELFRAAFIMHVCYNKQDIAAELLARHDKLTGSKYLSRYLEPDNPSVLSSGRH